MKLSTKKAIAEKLAIVKKHDLSCNPMQIIESMLFDDSTVKDYRDEAIDFAVNERLPLTNTENNTFEFVKRYIRVICPCCSTDMTTNSAGGNVESTTVSYNCAKCSTKFTLTTRVGDMSADFKSTKVQGD